jgi:hypothetical protein
MQAFKRQCFAAARLLAFVLAAFASIGSAEATSANTDVTDIWWSPAESGWGMQMINTGTYVYATIYVYGKDGTPTWYTGELRKDGVDRFSGPLYANTGSYFGGAFNRPANSRQVGTMQFVLVTVTTGELSYTVDGVAVEKPVERTPITVDDYSGSYLAGFTQTATDCVDPARNRTTTSTGTVTIRQDAASTVVVTKYDSGETCTLDGAYSQQGRMGMIAGSYACTSGESGTGGIIEMNNAPYMFTARLWRSSDNTGCETAGEFVGVIPR